MVIAFHLSWDTDRWSASVRKLFPQMISFTTANERASLDSSGTTV